MDIYTSADYDGLKITHAAGGVVRLLSNSLLPEAWNGITLQGDAGIVFGHNTGPNAVNFGFALTPRRSGISGLRMDHLGNVAIRTYDRKGYKLAVNGDAIFTKVKVWQFPWADNVFNDDYRLRSLSEVEQFIKAHRHLPEVPSEEEVRKNGLDVGENQATLLKKIEELTLYVIEQNKKIEQQQLEMNELKKHIKQFANR